MAKKTKTVTDEVTVTEGLPTETPAAVPADETPAVTEAVQPTENGKRGRGRPKNAERGNVLAEVGENWLDVTVSGFTLRYTPASTAPFIPAASVITADSARIMANVLSRAPLGGVLAEEFLTGLKGLGNVSLDVMLTVAQWVKAQ